MLPAPDHGANGNDRARTLMALLPAVAAAVLHGSAPGACPPCVYQLDTVAATACDPVDSPTLGRGINEAGIVVGAYTVCGFGTGEAFSWDGESPLHTLPRPAGIGGAGAWGVNDAGLIVGQMFLSGVADRAFIYDGSQFIDLGTLPGGTFSKGRGINNLGQAVGTWGNGVTGNPALAAFLWQGGVMVDLNARIGAPNSEAKDINDSGQVAGWMGTALADAHAFIWQDGMTTDLGVIPGGFTAAANAINSVGWVVGSGRVSTQHPPLVAWRAFLWNGSDMLNIGTLPGFDSGAASAINDRGEIVGQAWGVGGNPNVQTALLWHDGVMTDLNDLIPANSGIHITWATAINNQGQITGQADTDSSEIVAVLLTPIETPGDVDCDCSVGVIDLLTLLAAWGPCADCGDCPADLDGDCATGVTDLLVVLGNWS